MKVCFLKGLLLCDSQVDRYRSCIKIKRLVDLCLLYCFDNVFTGSKHITHLVGHRHFLRKKLKVEAY